MVLCASLSPIERIGFGVGKVMAFGRFRAIAGDSGFFGKKYGMMLQ